MTSGGSLLRKGSRLGKTTAALPPAPILNSDHSPGSTPARTFTNCQQFCNNQKNTSLQRGEFSWDLIYKLEGAKPECIPQGTRLSNGKYSSSKILDTTEYLHASSLLGDALGDIKSINTLLLVCLVCLAYWPWQWWECRVQPPIVGHRWQGLSHPGDVGCVDIVCRHILWPDQAVSDIDQPTGCSGMLWSTRDKILLHQLGTWKGLMSQP